MSSLYLAIVLGFLVLFFKQDQKEWPKFSLALWIPLVWFLSFSTRLIQIVLYRSDFTRTPGLPSIEASIEGDPISRMMAIVLISLGIYALYKKRSALWTVIRANSGIMVLFAYVLMTILWSEYPDVSIKRYIRLVGSLIIACIVASEEEHHKALEHLFRRYVAVCLTLSLFFIKTNRSIGFVIGVHGEHFMAGITGHKNDLGILCMYSLIFLCWRALRLWPRVIYLDWILIIINTYLLLRARSATALVLTISGIILMLGISMLRGSIKRLVIFLTILIVVTIPIYMIAVSSPSSAIPGALFEATGKDATLSGRIPMWQQLIGMGKKEIVFGSGYESFWLKHYTEIWARWTFLPVTAHNGYVDVLINIGIFGLAALILIISKLLIFLGSGVQLAHIRFRPDFVFLVMFVISNITESSLLKMTLGWYLFLIILLNNEKERLVGSP